MVCPNSAWRVLVEYIVGNVVKVLNIELDIFLWEKHYGKRHLYMMNRYVWKLTFMFRHPKKIDKALIWLQYIMAKVLRSLSYASRYSGEKMMILLLFEDFLKLTFIYVSAYVHEIALAAPESQRGHQTCQRWSLVWNYSTCILKTKLRSFQRITSVINLWVFDCSSLQIIFNRLVSIWHFHIRYN